MANSIIVSGGAGYIGSIVCRQLQKEGWRVIIVDNLSTGRIENIKGMIFHKADYADFNWLEGVVKEYAPIMVMHFAASAIVSESMEQPFKYYENNVVKFLSFINNLIKFGIKKIIFSSSAAVYGEPQAIPIKEEQKLAPNNVYGHTKKICEEVLHYCSQIYGLNYISLRYFNAAGAALEFNLGEYHEGETHLIPNILLSLLGKRPKFQLYGNDYPTPDGTCIRDFVHVLDISQAHLLAANYLLNNNVCDVFNIGNEKGYSIKEVVQVAEKITRKKLDLEFSQRRRGDPSVLIADSSKIKKILNWRPSHSSLEEIIGSQWIFFNSICNDNNLRMDR